MWTCAAGFLPGLGRVARVWRPCPHTGLIINGSGGGFRSRPGSSAGRKRFPREHENEAFAAGESGPGERQFRAGALERAAVVADLHDEKAAGIQVPPRPGEDEALLV